MSDIDEYKKELVDEMYCDDHYGELCDGDCDSCRRLAESNLNELENMVRADERAKIKEKFKIYQRLEAKFTLNQCKEKDGLYYLDVTELFYGLVDQVLKEKASTDDADAFQDNQEIVAGN